MRISATEINEFLRCRRAWSYGSPNRGNFRPMEPATALWLGEGVHTALEEFYRDGTDPIETFIRYVATLKVGWEVEGVMVNEATSSKAFKLGVTMLQGYLARYGATPEDDIDGISVLVTEQEFAVAIPETADGWLVGRMDGLLRDKIGRLWLLEHKTYSMLPDSTSTHVLNPQISCYVWATQTLINEGAFAHLGIEPGERIHGALYNGLRKKEPGPQIQHPLFMREWVTRSPQELEDFAAYLYAVHEEMTNPNIRLYPTVAKHCDWCSYKHPCITRFQGGDDEWVLQASYSKAEKRGAVYADVEAS